MVRHRPVTRLFLAVALIIQFTGCDDTPSAPIVWDLLDSHRLMDWKPAENEDQGRTSITAQALRLEEGRPMTGLVYTAWEREGFPTNRYAVSYEARRTKGTDFFAALTFPVNDSHLTFVPGGWSGATTGLSNIDGMAAIDNPTGSAQRFEQGVWYRFRIEVRPETIRVWMNERLIINLHLAGRSIDLKLGDIEKCRPFGFASYGTEGEIRAVKMETLPDES